MLTPEIKKVLTYALGGSEYAASFEAQTLASADNLLRVVTGQFKTAVGGTIIAGSQVGAGWTVAAGGTVGSYIVTYADPATATVSVTAQASTAKAAGAAGDSFESDVSAWSGTGFTVRTIDRTTLAVTGEANAVVQFVAFVYNPSPTPPLNPSPSNPFLG